MIYWVTKNLLFVHPIASLPLASGAGVALTALAFIRDPQLGELDTPNGRVVFLQLVGLTPDELALARRRRTDGVLGVLAERDPLLVTNLYRQSLLSDPVTRSRLEALANAGAG